MDSYWKLGNKVFVQGKIISITDSIQDGILYGIEVKSPTMLSKTVVMKGGDITEKVGCEKQGD